MYVGIKPYMYSSIEITGFSPVLDNQGLAAAERRRSNYEPRNNRSTDRRRQKFFNAQRSH